MGKTPVTGTTTTSRRINEKQNAEKNYDKINTVEIREERLRTHTGNIRKSTKKHVPTTPAKHRQTNQRAAQSQAQPTAPIQ